ncbi:chlorophyllase [Micromonospora sp. KC721]|uniref:alpha/beta hydrolase family protein n=1 Tax=Micromonospora sp. KC721 TaxID=2530380 RepID=UPI001053233B|nr:chlorophyllase [Micromonospora sp. KC721]TDB77351.1 chlorophyllase [Micromonospora sp. KC721]
MPRRPTPIALAAVLLAAALAGCSATPTPAATPAAASKPPAATTPAPAPAGSAPSETFAVGVRLLRLNRGGDRPLPVTIWYPASGDAGKAPKRGATAANGRFPVVVFSHGLGGRPDDYAALLTPWTAAGFVVAAPTFPHTSRGTDNNAFDVLKQPADVSYVLDQVLALDTKADDPLRGRLATDRVAAAGHSAGGVTTIGLFGVNRDKRLDAGLVFAGTGIGVGTAFAGTAAPQLFVHGQADEVVKYAAGKAVYDAVPWPKAMLSLPKGDHGRGLLGNGAALRVITDTSVDFLRWTLYGDEKAKARIPEGATRGGIATLDDHL